MTSDTWSDGEVKLDFSMISKFDEREVVLGQWMTAIVCRLEARLSGEFEVIEIKSRVKSIDSLKKKISARASSPAEAKTCLTSTIKDQIGIRIICRRQESIGQVNSKLSTVFNLAESDVKGEDDPTVFVYRGTHGIYNIPVDIKSELSGKEASLDLPQVFEVQIKTIFMHAVGEIGHSYYKLGLENLPKSQRRILSALEAQAWAQDNLTSQLDE